MGLGGGAFRWPRRSPRPESQGRQGSVWRPASNAKIVETSCGRIRPSGTSQYVSIHMLQRPGDVSDLFFYSENRAQPDPLQHR